MTFKLKEIQKDPFNDFVGDEPRMICPENIVIHIPHSKFSGPEIILGGVPEWRKEVESHLPTHTLNDQGLRTK